MYCHFLTGIPPISQLFVQARDQEAEIMQQQLNEEMALSQSSA